MNAGAKGELRLPDEASYLFADNKWKIVAIGDTSSSTDDLLGASIVGHHVQDILGPAAFQELATSGSALLSLDEIQYALTARRVELPSGPLYLIRAEEAQATLEFLLSMLVHEVRSPLSALRTLVEALAEEVAQHPSAPNYTTRITAEIDRLARLLNSMAQVARPASRPPEPLMLPPLLEHVANVFQPELAQRGIALTVRATHRAGPILGDADQLQQMLVNLIANARDAMPGGGQITLRARRDPRGHPLLQVEDSGAGMSPATQATALRPRYASTKPGGMGLGLLIVRSIVRQHQARLRFVSQPGHGTTVSITFPSLDTGAPEQDYH